MMTEPTSPMSDDSRLVTVWVSIVRTSVTSFDRREMSSPTRWLEWKSSDSVISRPKSSPRIWATTRSPTTPSRYVCRKPPAAWTRNSATSMTISWSSPTGIAAGDDLGRDPGDDERERETDGRRDDEAHERDGEGPPVRPEVAEQPGPGHAPEAAHLADDGPGVGRDARELLAHGAMMSRPPGIRRRPPLGVSSGRRTRSRSGCRARCARRSGSAANGSARRSPRPAGHRPRARPSTGSAGR